MLNALSPNPPHFYNIAPFLQVSTQRPPLENKDLLLLVAACVILIFAIFLVIAIRFASKQKRANKCMEELEKTREKFFSIISHDLKGPFGGFSELLDYLVVGVKDLSRQELEKNLHLLSELSRHMGLLLDNLLEWTRSVHETDAYSPCTLSLRKVIDQTITMYLPLAKAKGIQLHAECPGELSVIADNNMLMLVIRNMLDNAMRFAGHNGTVRISAREAGPDVVVSIEDTGPGIDPEKFNHLVERFPVWNRPGNSKPGKHGMGLPLCAEFIRKWGGRIWQESPEGSIGSRVMFTVKKKNLS